jgi:hypothetical protein
VLPDTPRERRTEREMDIDPIQHAKNRTCRFVEAHWFDKA